MIELNARVSSALFSVRLVHSLKYRESDLRMFHATSEPNSRFFLHGESIHDDDDGDGGDDARRTRTLFGGGGAAKTGSLSPLPSLLPLILVDRCCRDSIILSWRRGEFGVETNSAVMLVHLLLFDAVVQRADHLLVS